ncbi:hypothetical protein J7354_15945 [Sulfitobacter sp. R18_2]|uniref:hypothetical protein n=1 Tax=Sulfitobacter sp. R18_2 TaxID=2821105 RepID=UPI001ADA3ACE|nr:hypothetical protein [Sulfitobacter sp. R18_2]MBO9440149.1 hypothetical protein [Sulfitobacter sp. R18_2]
MFDPFRLSILAIAFGMAVLGTATYAKDRVYVMQATTGTKMVYVRQAMEVPDQRAARARAARSKRTQQAQRNKTSVQVAQTADASMLSLEAANAPVLPIAHIAVE